jgi:quinol monooxygenase YgiN
MIIRLTFSHADPDKVTDIRALYLSQELNDFFNSQKGHRFHYLLESGEDKSDIVFLTAWDSVEEMDAAYASEAHHIVGSKFKPFLTAPSSKRIYEVHEA